MPTSWHYYPNNIAQVHNYINEGMQILPICLALNCKYTCTIRAKAQVRYFTYAQSAIFASYSRRSGRGGGNRTAKGGGPKTREGIEKNKNR